MGQRGDGLLAQAVANFAQQHHVFRGCGRCSLDLPLSLARGLAELSRRENATLFMTALAAFDVLLYRYTNQDDISVGAPVANRTRPETEGLLGFFVNTLVLRTELAPELPFVALLARVRARQAAAAEAACLPRWWAD